MTRTRLVALVHRRPSPAALALTLLRGGVAVAALGAPALSAQPTGRPHAGPTRDPITSVAVVVRLARDTAPASRVARSSARIAAHAADLAATPLLPFVSLDASALRQTLNLAAFGFPGPSAASDPFSVYSAGIRVQQALLDPAAWRRWRAQRDSAGAAAGDAEAGRDGIATLAASRYFQLLATEAALDGRLADSALAQAVLIEVAARRRVGEVTDIDLTRARLGVTAAAARLTDARAARAQARLELGLAIGIGTDGVPEVRDSLRSPASVPDAIDTMTAMAVRDLVARRPDVVAGTARRRAADGAVRARQLEYLPRISAFGEYQAIGVTAGTLPAVYRVGVQASIPLVDGLSRRHRGGLDAERMRIATALADEVTLRATREIEGARVELRRATAALAVADAQLALAFEELEQARRRVRVGIGGTLETTQGIAAVAAARDQVIGGRLRYHLARLEWHRATATLDALH
ncbi:MAG: TolC family protein [Gemmatimonadaceae bacterium]|nr:TolC family protein [Gemmatimonadaceae bacterium]